MAFRIPITIVLTHQLCNFEQILQHYYSLERVQSFCLSSHPCAFLHDGRMDFLHIRYHGQVSWATDACKIEFCSVPNLSIYGHLKNNFECLLFHSDISMKTVVILFIFGTGIRYHALLMLVN